MLFNIKRFIPHYSSFTLRFPTLQGIFFIRKFCTSEGLVNKFMQFDCDFPNPNFTLSKWQKINYFFKDSYLCTNRKKNDAAQ